MKSKFIVLGLLFLAIGFTGNWIYGNLYAKKLDLYLQQFPVSHRPQYTDIKVNPLCSKITFKNFSLVYAKSKLKVESDVLHVKIKHREAMQISKTQRVDKITSLGLNFENVKLTAPDEVIFSGSHVKIDFEGDMSSQKYLALGSIFPSEMQKLSLKIENGIWMQQPKQSNWFTHFISASNHIEFADISMVLNHSQHTLGVERMNFSTGAMQLAGNAMLEYSGQGIDDFVPSQINVKYDSKSNRQLTWGNSQAGNKFSLQSFNSAFEGELKLDENNNVRFPVSNAIFSLHLKYLNMEYDGRSGSGMEAQLMMLGLVQEDLNVEELWFNTTISDGRCIIDNTSMVIPVLSASLNADIKLYGNNMDSTKIETMELRIGKVEPNLQASLSNFERAFGFKIPRSGEDLILEINGSLKSPKIKGIHY